MKLDQRPGWRPRVVSWVARLLGVTTYPVPWYIVIYDARGDLAEHYRQQRDEDEGLH